MIIDVVTERKRLMIEKINDAVADYLNTHSPLYGMHFICCQNVKPNFNCLKNLNDDHINTYIVIV